MSHDGKEGGAKAPIASRVEAPRAPTTKARLDMGVFEGGVCLAAGGGTLGGFVGDDGVVLG